jgi:hypothetical protein
MSSPTPNAAPLTQGIFYVVSGLWPIIHLRSFERVTGRKTDRWLAQTMGGVIASIGVALIVGAFEKPPSRALQWLGIGSALALGAADTLFATRGRISKVYLADAAAEGAAIAGWVINKRARA